MIQAAPGPAVPFDALAASYDQRFTERPLGQALRRRVWRVLDGTFHAGEQVLDLGSGTGADAVHLAERGVNVHGLDGSAAMVAVARERVRRAGAAGRVTFETRPIETLSEAVFDRPFDGALSDFGALNCVADLRRLGRDLGCCVRPGGRFVAVVMGPICGGEIAWFMAHGRPRSAFRRVRRGGVVVRVGGLPLIVRYPTPHALGRALQPWFRRVGIRALGIALPPTDAATWIESRPARLAWLDRLDGRLDGTPGAAWLSDHYIATFVRTEHEA